MFTVEAVEKTQNDRILAESSNAVPEGSQKLFRRMKPAGVMVWAAVSSDGRKSPLVFIEQGTKVNSVVYMKLLEENVLPWVTQAFGDNYVFIQDGAPSHMSNVTQQWCKSHFSGFWDKNAWVPSSPDINPMDFTIWSILESDVSRVSDQNVTALKKALVASWDLLNEEGVRTNLTSPANEPFSSNLGIGVANTNINAPSNFQTNNMNNEQIGFPAVPSSNVGATFDASLPVPSVTASSISTSSSLTATQLSDRYAALADLDSLFGSVQTTQASTWDGAPTSSSSTGWQTTATDVSNTTTTTTASTAEMPTAFGDFCGIFSHSISHILVGDSSKSNPFGGGGGGGGGAPQVWNQQPVASQFPAQVWNHQQNSTPIQGASWNQQPNPTPGQLPAWNQQMPVQPPAVSSWLNSSSGQVPAQQSWNQQQQQQQHQPMPSQASFNTGNPFQMGQPIASNANAPSQTGGAFPTQNSFGANAPFNSGQIGSLTATVPSDANSGFANFNAANNMNSGFAAFPAQNVTSPPDSQAQFTVQNGGFRPSTNDGWNTDSSSLSWGSATPQQFHQDSKPVNNAGIAAPSQFANWQPNQGVAPSNPFMGSGAASSQEPPKMNSSNPFL
ncbi:Transposable element Tcb2 transposase [Nymphon striatum]|nr:Transposable element Tcb2 transposase [Nymphon striatum]